MDNLLNVITIIGSMIFVTIIGVRFFNLKFTKYDNGTWVIYNEKIFDEADEALKELKKEIDTLTKRVKLSEKRAELLKAENASLKELCNSREEQVYSLSSSIEEHNINIEPSAPKHNIHIEPSAPDKEPNNPNYAYAVIRDSGLQEESEEAIRNSAETLNRILVRNQNSDEQ